MPNKNYVAGRKREYQIKEELEKDYTVFRTSGSHGCADIIAVNKKNGCVRFIQSKVVEKERQPTNKEIKEFIKALPVMRFGNHREIWIKTKYGENKITVVETTEEWLD